MTLVPRLIALAAIALANLRADPRSSASYSITSETLDSAGEIATSPAYQISASLGDSSHPSQTSANATGDAGFIARLATTSGLALSADEPFILETGTRQVTAWESLSDGTRAALPPTAVAWSIASGPVTISAAGLLTAVPVFLDTAATAAATFGEYHANLPIMVINSASDNFGSYANDSLPDDWQVLYFGVSNPNASPTQDPDRDGFNNLFEYRASLVPTDPSSRFQLICQPVPGQPIQRQILFSPRYDSATYTVEVSTDLRNWSPLTSFSTTDLGTLRTVTDLAATSQSVYYRVQLTRP
jgi:hypothetical protein